MQNRIAEKISMAGATGGDYPNIDIVNVEQMLVCDSGLHDVIAVHRMGAP